MEGADAEPYSPHGEKDLSQVTFMGLGFRLQFFLLVPQLPFLSSRSVAMVQLPWPLHEGLPHY